MAIRLSRAIVPAAMAATLCFAWVVAAAQPTGPQAHSREAPPFARFADFGHLPPPGEFHPALGGSIRRHFLTRDLLTERRLRIGVVGAERDLVASSQP